MLRAYTAVVVEVTEEDYKEFKDNGNISEEIEERAIEQVKDKPEWQFHDAYLFLSEED